MALVQVFQESDRGVASPPWETASRGVVSLLVMLEFSAAQYVELSYQFGLMLGKWGKTEPSQISFNDCFTRLMADVSALGLPVTFELLSGWFAEVMEQNPGKASWNGTSLEFTGDIKYDDARVCHHLETIHKSLKAELGAVLFRAIPRERAKYSNAKWLESSSIQTKFPTAFKELDRAGACYSLGQSTASVFHCMRAMEPALIALAKPFNISTAHENWNVIIEGIERSVREYGKQLAKSQQKNDDETFYGAATSHLFFVKNAWRNHVAHGPDSYSDDEALKILSHTLEFVESLCARLQE
jgi:hypothetical protein